MSATDIFRNRDPMQSEQDPQFVNVIQTRADSTYAPLPGSVKFPNDVRNTRAGMPNPTGRRP
jgi:hypothetical protein